MDSLNFKDMKNYTIIPNYASEKFSPNDLYTITGIYLTANDRYITDSTYEQIASFTGQSLSYSWRCAPHAWDRSFLLPSIMTSERLLSFLRAQAKTHRLI